MGHDPEHVAALREDGTNALYLPGVALPESMEHTADRAEAVRGATGIVLATPSQFYGAVARSFAGELPEGAPLVSVSKGLDPDTQRRLTEVAASELGRPVAVLSGPSHAEEVALGAPTAVTVGASDASEATFWQDRFSAPTFRVYVSDDPVGVELGGVLKNIMAIAAGVADGIGYGDNAKAALITRGLAEVRRLGTAMGARPETFTGLSGLGDLVVTCASRHSRNRGLGERLGRGEALADILASTQKVAEGYWSAATARKVAQRLGIEVPITDEVYAILYKGKDPRAAVQDLLTRAPGSE